MKSLQFKCTLFLLMLFGYQIDVTASTTTISNIINVVYAIKNPPVTPTLSTLQAATTLTALQTAMGTTTTLNPIATTASANPPTAITIGIANNSFAIPLSKLPSTVNWTNGVNLVLLAFNNNNLITNLTTLTATTAPTSLQLFILDGTSNAVLGNISIAPSTAQPSGAWNVNTMTALATTTGTAVTGTYPAIVQISLPTAPLTQTTLLASLTAAKITPTTLNFSALSTFAFTGINFNMGSNTGWGYAFGTYPAAWGTSTTVGPNGLSADISSIISAITPAQWQAGISFMLLALSSANAPIADITKTAPASYALYMFDSTGNPLPNTPVAVNAANVTPLNKQTPPVSFTGLTNVIATGMSPATGASTVPANTSAQQTYPTLVTLTIAAAPAAPLTQSQLLAGLASSSITVSLVSTTIAGSAIPEWSYTMGQKNPWQYTFNTSSTAVTGTTSVSSSLSALTAAQLQAGISSILIALDSSNNIISDLTKTAPASWALYLFDSTGNALPNSPVAVPLTNGVGVNKQTTMTTFATNPTLISMSVNNWEAASYYPLLCTMQTSTSAANIIPQPIQLAANATLSSLTITILTNSTNIACEQSLKATTITAINKNLNNALLNVQVTPNATSGNYDLKITVVNSSSNALITEETYSSITNSDTTSKRVTQGSPIPVATATIASDVNVSYQIAQGSSTLSASLSGVPLNTNLLTFVTAS